MRTSFYTAFAITLACVAPSLAFAAEYTLTVKDHAFTPKELNVAAGEKITLTVNNEDATPIEFESRELKREKVIPAGKSATVLIGTLEKGTYHYVDEFHEDVANGTIVAK